MCRIQPVPRRKQSAALRHVVSGSVAKDVWADMQARPLAKLLQATPDERRWFWWTLDEHKVLAAALILASLGKVGFVYHSPPDLPGVGQPALVELLRAICGEGLAGGLSMVQSLVDPAMEANAESLTEAGFEAIAELIYMGLAVTAPPVESGPAGDNWTFRNGREFAMTELTAVIRATYRDALDCPRLSGTRQMADVIKSHRNTGQFSPEWWWLLACDDVPAGCVLMNRTSRQGVAEVVYMGVVPEFRGKGIGGILMGRAISTLHENNCDTLRLAVDSRNIYAKRLYDRFGFEEMYRKRCFAVLAEGVKSV
jgi:GNAT superfamily N-acetyltransferase